jgi:hypothetical protein
VHPGVQLRPRASGLASRRARVADGRVALGGTALRPLLDLPASLCSRRTGVRPTGRARARAVLTPTGMKVSIPIGGPLAHAVHRDRVTCSSANTCQEPACPESRTPAADRTTSIRPRRTRWRGMRASRSPASSPSIMTASAPAGRGVGPLPGGRRRASQSRCLLAGTVSSMQPGTDVFHAARNRRLVLGATT